MLSSWCIGYSPHRQLRDCLHFFPCLTEDATTRSSRRAGVPMEVMGPMLGEFVDDYTVRAVDVFAIPQSGMEVSVEAVDPVFRTKTMDALRQTGR